MYQSRTLAIILQGIVVYNYPKAQQGCLQLSQVFSPYCLTEYIGQTNGKSYQ